MYGGVGHSVRTGPAGIGLAVVVTIWLLWAGIGYRRRGERLRVAWAGLGAARAALTTTCLALAPSVSGDGQICLVAGVSTLLVAAQYVLAIPACTGGLDPAVPPWPLRSQRRATALIRPLCEVVSVIGPVLAFAVSPWVALAAVLGAQILGLVLVLLALPHATAILR